MKNSGFLIGLTLLSIGALAYSILFVTNGATPNIIGWLGVVASVLSIIGTRIKLAAPSSEIVYKIGYPLMILFVITFGIWLLFYPREIP